MTWIICALLRSARPTRALSRRIFSVAHCLKPRLFGDADAMLRLRRQQEAQRQRERSMQQTLLDIKKKYGKNAILRGMNLQDGATAITRNASIGGHKA